MKVHSSADLPHVAVAASLLSWRVCDLVDGDEPRGPGYGLLFVDENPNPGWVPASMPRGPGIRRGGMELVLFEQPMAGRSLPKAFTGVGNEHLARFDTGRFRGQWARVTYHMLLGYVHTLRFEGVSPDALAQTLQPTTITLVPVSALVPANALDC